MGGAWQGWDTKCSAELLAWHWLTVKLRFAGGTRETGATGSSGSTTRQAYMEPLLIYTADSLGRSTLCVDGLPPALHSAPAPSVSLAAVELECRAGGGVLVPLSDVSFHPSAVHKPLGTNRAPLDHARPPGHQATTSAAVEQIPKTTEKSLTRPDRRLTVEGRLKLDGLTAGHADRSGPLGELSLAPSNLAPYIAGHTLTGLHRPQMLSTSGTA